MSITHINATLINMEIMEGLRMTQQEKVKEILFRNLKYIDLSFLNKNDFEIQQNYRKEAFLPPTITIN